MKDEEGVMAEKKKQIGVSFDDMEVVFDWIKEMAKENERTLGGQVRFMLRKLFEEVN